MAKAALLLNAGLKIDQLVIWLWFPISHQWSA